MKHINTRESILIKGARANNLKNIDLVLPKNKLIVVTGVSGSGKSSITMDTLYAEGQRRYVESLSSYARQFLDRMKKPEVDYIHGICPAIAIEQRTSAANARSTVGSITEIYDFLRLLYARIGKTYSPVSGNQVRKHQVSDVVDYIHRLPESAKVILLMPPHQKYKDRTLEQELLLFLNKGYTRVYKGDQLIYIEDLLKEKENLKMTIANLRDEAVRIVVDRFAVQHEDEENRKRIADSVYTAFDESGGNCILRLFDGEEVPFNNRFELDGLEFPEPSPHLFNFNNPYGACPRCEGFGRIMGIDPAKVIPDPGLSLYEGAVQCWKGEKSSKYLDRLLSNAHLVDFPVHLPYRELTDMQKTMLWEGNEHFYGIYDYFKHLEEKSYKIQNRVMIARYRGKTTCPECNGGRLRKETQYVRIGGRNIQELIEMPIDELLEFFEKLEISTFDRKVAERLLLEIKNRLMSMRDLGLEYLHLDRTTASLSGGELQRIYLTKSLGSNLANSLYILDEPSIGLHPKDTLQLIAVLQKLRDLSNTVVVVEHEEEIIRHADYLVDMGPRAGIHGGEVIFAGPVTRGFKNGIDSLTMDYLNGKLSVPVPGVRRKPGNRIFITNAHQHNLQHIDVEIPLHALNVVCGVSGSGKSTLVQDILYNALREQLGETGRDIKAAYDRLEGDVSLITKSEMITQQPIGKSSRSNPVTYVKAYDPIRKLMADQQLSKIRGYQPGHFSFNVEGGRCETCSGEGEILVEMQFLADVRLVCEDCKGQRFKHEVLEVQYNGKNIYQILDLSVEEALEFFKKKQDIVNKLKPLNDVGLGYVKLGQSSSTLSGGEAQRVKLASFLTKDNPDEHIFFIFDEPTTGLHFHDVGKLLEALNALIENGNTVLVVEHNLDVIKSADWVIDLGPGGGKHGGNLLFQGTPEDLLNCEDSYTAKFLLKKINITEGKRGKGEEGKQISKKQ